MRSSSHLETKRDAHLVMDLSSFFFDLTHLISSRIFHYLRLYQTGRQYEIRRETSRGVNRWHNCWRYSVGWNHRDSSHIFHSCGYGKKRKLSRSRPATNAAPNLHHNSG